MGISIYQFVSLRCTWLFLKNQAFASFRGSLSCRNFLPHVTTIASLALLCYWDLFVIPAKLNILHLLHVSMHVWYNGAIHHLFIILLISFRNCRAHAVVKSHVAEYKLATCTSFTQCRGDELEVKAKPLKRKKF